MSSIGMDGIVSGLDTSEIISALVEVYSAPRYRLENTIDTLTDRMGALTELLGTLEAMKTSLGGLDSASDFDTWAATSSSDALGVVASSDSLPGSHSIEIDSLATSAMLSSQGFATRATDNAIQAGSYRVTYGGVETTVTIGADETSLNDFVAAINEQVEGVTAYVLDTGAAVDRYKMVLTGDDTGAENSLSLTAVSTAEPGALPVFGTTRAAADAELSVDGISVFSASNVVENVLPGLTLTLNQAGTGPIQIGVTRDTDALLSKVNAFITGYNNVRLKVSTETMFDQELGIRGDLVGEGSTRRVVSSLSSAITSTYGSGAYNALSRMGITSSSETGLLTLDSDTFLDAFQSDPDGVIEFFTGSGSLVETLESRLDLYIDSSTGSIVDRTESLESLIADYNERVTMYEARAARYEERLLNSFTNMEIILGQLETTQSTLTYYFDNSNNDS